MARDALPPAPGVWPEYRATIEVPDDIWHAPPAGPEGSSVESLIKRMGGKSQLRDWLISVFPYDVKAYVEPFGGSMKVLLWKGRRADIEVINDIDGDMIHFFYCARHNPREFVDYINNLPMHEALVYGCREEMKGHRWTGLERAAAWYLSHASGFNAEFTAHSFGVSPYVSLDHRLSLQDVQAVASRLAGVTICSGSWTRLVEKMNKPIPPVKGSRHNGVFFYFDSPYDETSGYTTHQGASQFDRRDQKALADACYEIHQTGNRFLATNSATDFIKRLYASYTGPDGKPCFYLTERNVRYSMAAEAENRKDTAEAIISNFPLRASGAQVALL